MSIFYQHPFVFNDILNLFNINKKKQYLLSYETNEENKSNKYGNPTVIGNLCYSL